MTRIKTFITCTMLFMLGTGSLACNSSEFTLTTNSNPMAGGSIAPDGGTYAKGLKVTVTATPSNGYRFDRWEGGASGSSPTVQVAIDSNKQLVAQFTKTFSVAALASPTTGGTITPSNGSFDQSSNITLIASPAQYFKFNGWGGDATGMSDHLAVTMDSNKQIMASFVRQVFSLQVQSDPLVGGTTDFTSGNCEAGSQKIITASPSAGYRFDHWGGGASGTTNPVSVLVDSNKNVVAYFTKLYTLTLLASPANSGVINTKGGVYDAGARVDLSATPSFPYYLKNWVGVPSNNISPTTVTMNNDNTVTAIFAQGTKGTLQTITGAMSTDPRFLAVVSIPIQLNKSDWIQGDMVIVTNTGGVPIKAYIQDPSGNIVKDFGSANQGNFTFVAQTTGRYTVVFQNNSIWYAGYTLNYTVWNSQQ
ncbi:MAG: hypothetical protein Q7J73_07970 [Dehalococcoidales bacterium]|nr:hypothetical protein [Dehalococcoidales bacterium]